MLADAAVAPRVAYGDRVTAGETIAVLVNHEVARELVRLEGECRRQTIVIEALRRQQFTAPESSARLSTARSVLQELEQQLEQHRRDAAALTLKAPTDGVLYPPLDAAEPAPEPLRREGGPLQGRNAQTYLAAGTIVGVVGMPDAFDALLVVDQVDIPEVRPGQRVRLRIPQAGASGSEGRVREVAARALDASPEALVHSGQLASRVGADGLVRPVRPVYEVRVEITNPPAALAVASAGDARIDAGSMNAARRVLRWFEATFARDR
jgi:putative peptide zinc metalloprotease protein